MKGSVMDQPEYWRLKKVFLYSLVASVTLSAAFGMYTILVGRFGWFEGRIMMTTLTIGAASIAGLACRAYLSRSPYHPIPLVGLGLTSLAVVMFLVKCSTFLVLNESSIINNSPPLLQNIFGSNML